MNFISFIWLGRKIVGQGSMKKENKRKNYFFEESVRKGNHIFLEIDSFLSFRYPLPY